MWFAVTFMMLSCFIVRPCETLMCNFFLINRSFYVLLISLINVSVYISNFVYMYVGYLPIRCPEITISC